MMKQDRQSLILEIIAEKNVETQEQLLSCLQERGVVCTQATISRDIKDLRLIKQQAGQGVYKYAATASRAGLNMAEKLRGIFRESVTGVDCAQNMVVLKTMPGLASAACSALDHMEIPYVLGSLAGDDTAFLVTRDAEAAQAFCAELREML